MPDLTQHQSSEFVKLLYIGDSGTGKTGSLVSLAAAGYELCILDLDNGLDALRHLVIRECPDKAKTVKFESAFDKLTMTATGPVCRSPTAFVTSLKLLEKWSDGTDPAAWGSKTILVIDSLTALGRAALRWASGMNPLAKEPRTWYNVAQLAIENTLGMLTSKDFKTNVIVISHISYREPIEGNIKGYASAVGAALGPKIPTFFNTFVQAEILGTGKNAVRRIRTSPTGIIDLKNPVPFKFDVELPLGTGLATLFEKIKEN